MSEDSNEASVQSVVVPLSDVFLIMGCRCKRKFTRQLDCSFLYEVARPGEVFQFHDSISEETARDWFNEADNVWVPAKA